MSENRVQESAGNPQETLVEMAGAVIANDGNIILADVDITIRKGEFVYLLGKVGSGKSSIIKTLIAELPLKKGEAAVAGYNLRKIKRRHIPFLRRKLGVIFQDFQLLMDRSVEDNLLFVLEATGWKKRSQMAERAREVLAMVGLEEKAKKMPHQLSGGEQQRVAIARAFLNNPQVILADEPTGNLDEDTATDIMNLFMQIHEEQQPAVLMVTHNRELYKRYPGRVLICEEGSVREMEQEIEFELHDEAAAAGSAEPAGESGCGEERLDFELNDEVAESESAVPVGESEGEEKGFGLYDEAAAAGPAGSAGEKDGEGQEIDLEI